MPTSKPTELAKRIAGQSLTQEEIVLRWGYNASHLARMVAEDRPSDDLTAKLDAAERDGLPPLPKPRWEVQLDAARGMDSRDAQEARGIQRREEIAAARAAFEEANLRARAEATERYKREAVERVEFGLRLRSIRESIGLDMKAVAAITGISDDILGRAERGKLDSYGGRLQVVLDAYEGIALLKTAPAQAKAAKA
jgi:hypothetical protein